MKGDAKLCIDYKVCSIYEHVSILRCFKCNQYNHSVNNCPNEESCGNSHEYKTKTCLSNNPNKCINCINANKKFNPKLDVNHTSFDISCPTYLRLVNQRKVNIDYTIPEDD